LAYIEESLYDEDTYKISLGFKNSEEIEIFVNKKTLNKEFTFLKKRINKRKYNYIIRVSNSKKIMLVQNNKELINNFYYLDV
jgi:hypothetical protein